LKDQFGDFRIPAETIRKKLQSIKAFVFDWDGVFNAGEKNEAGSSSFNEVDSMGVNLLRFSHWLATGKIPVTAVISGEKNASSFYLSSREHFEACYFKVSHKTDALKHLCSTHHLVPEEVAFIFDDVLDLSMAKECGLRFLVNRPGPSLFRNYVLANNLTDYVSSNFSGDYPVREITEIISALRGNLETTLEHRITYSTRYQEYLLQRNSTETLFFTRKNGLITAENPDLY
jgi:3-deoxy-D-manno-octulosonate 8-phosphate phosphatase (KDO 8-P phosphatase)